MRIPGFFLIWKKVSRKKPKIGGGASKKKGYFPEGGVAFRAQGGGVTFRLQGGGELHLPHLVHMYACALGGHVPPHEAEKVCHSLKNRLFF